ncbi:MAG: hypothetical protein QOE56_754 [Solirubrobacterales bacterium]|jgi:hypothetical protein|nr:hypothetical protein [Solirubrobacterales bacterium]
MPLEGHYKRVNTPLRKLNGREIKVLVIGTIVTLVVCLGLLFLPSSNGGSIIQDKTGKSCVEVFVAGRVGSEPVAGCGAKAVSICQRASQFDDPRAHTIINACLAEGIKY